MGGKPLGLGLWATEKDAAEAYDRAVLHYLGAGARRNFPKRRLPAADADALKEEARQRFKRETASRYRGVFRTRQRWQARLSHEGRHESLGGWRTQREAAEAYDRASSYFFGKQAALNFPERRLGPEAPAELRRLARLVHKKRNRTSKYLGVWHHGNRSSGGRPWIAELTPAMRKHRFLGSWKTELAAARAYDRAARFYFGSLAELNLPNEDLEPADAAALASEAIKEAKAAYTSQYRGVSWSERDQHWIAQTKHRGRNLVLGTFKLEDEAARAYDAKSIQLRGVRARLNFHPVTDEPIWGKRVAEVLSERGLRSPSPSRPRSRPSR
jgi:hypothetical protein